MMPHGTVEVQTGCVSGGVITAANLAELGEFGLIDTLRSWLPSGPAVLTGIGDDAAVLAAPDGRVVATTDFLLEGRHFRLDWSSAADVGHKAAARSLADVAAMGAVPTGLLVALAAPPSLPVAWLRDFTQGLAAECARAGASVAGGDTSRFAQVLLAITGLGDLRGRAPVLRSGARPGDVVAVAGVLGRAAAGLALLTSGVADPVDLIAAQLRPSPPYDAGPEAARLGATAMIDVSDGLLADLGHIADASEVLIDVFTEALKDPLIRTACGDTAELSYALTGGEDHSLVATFPADVHLPARWKPIGEVRPAHSKVRPGHGVTVDGAPHTGAPGWDHFRPQPPADALASRRATQAPATRRRASHVTRHTRHSCNTIRVRANVSTRTGE
jgi:thiamine-monophosphate kinase